MLIDIVLAILLILAIVKGLQRGMIVAIFSFLGFIVGLIAAVKLSTVVAEYMAGSVNISARWLPFLSFLLVFLVVVLLVRLLARIVQSTIEMAMLGWVNRIGGILLYAITYTVIVSVMLFYAVQMRLIKEDTIDASVSYSLLRPIGPLVIDSVGRLLPWFADMFTELKNFFDRLSEKIPPPGLK